VHSAVFLPPSSPWHTQPHPLLLTDSKKRGDFKKSSSLGYFTVAAAAENDWPSKTDKLRDTR